MVRGVYFLLFITIILDNSVVTKSSNELEPEQEEKPFEKNKIQKIPRIGIEASNIPHQKIPLLIYKALHENSIELIDTCKQTSNEALVSRAILRYYKQHLLLASNKIKHVHVMIKVWYTHLGYERTNLSIRESLQDLNSILSLDPSKLVIHVHAILQYSHCISNTCQEEEDALSDHVKSLGSNNDSNNHNSSPLENPTLAWKGSWRALEEMYTAGIIQSIGVSNFSFDEMVELFDIATISPHVYQASLDSVFTFNTPGDESNGILELLNKHKVQIQLYNIGSVLHDQQHTKAFGILERIGMSYNQNVLKQEIDEIPPSSIILAWLLQHDYSIIPGTSNENHLAQNSPRIIEQISKFTARHDIDIEHAIRSLLSNNETTSSITKYITEDERSSSRGVVATFFNGISKAVKLFLITTSSQQNQIHVPVTVWMEPGKSKRVLALPKDVFVACDGHGNVLKKFWISVDHGNEEMFSIEL